MTRQEIDQVLVEAREATVEWLTARYQSRILAEDAYHDAVVSLLTAWEAGKLTRLTPALVRSRARSRLLDAVRGGWGHRNRNSLQSEFPREIPRGLMRQEYEDILRTEASMEDDDA